LKPYLKNDLSKKSQVLDHLPRKYEALSSNPSTDKKKKKEYQKRLSSLKISDKPRYKHIKESIGRSLQVLKIHFLFDQSKSLGEFPTDYIYVTCLVLVSQLMPE
jgi:hypothetical protein